MSGENTSGEKKSYGDLPKMEIRTGAPVDQTAETASSPAAADAAATAEASATDAAGEWTPTDIRETDVLTPATATTAADTTAAATTEPITKATASSSTGDRKIVETAVDLKPASAGDGVAATERLRAARGQTGRARTRETAVTTAKATKSSGAERETIPSSSDLGTTAKKRYVRAITLWLIAAVVGGIAALLAWHPGAVGTENKAFVNNGETAKVMSQLSELACTPFTYTWQTITEDMQHTMGGLVGVARDEFIRTAEANRSIVVQRQADSQCQVDHLALASLDKNSATAIGVLIIQVNTGGKPAQALQPRMQFSLEKVGDDWKLSEISDVQ